MDHYYITGVSSGIGLSLVKALLLSQEELYIHGYSRQDPLIADERFNFHPTDLSDTDRLIQQVPDFFKEKTDKIRRIVLINNAGILGNVAFAGEQQTTHYSTTFAVNTMAPMILCEFFIKRFQQVNAEKIIFNISSGAASKTIEGWAAYCASKAALDRFTTVSAQEQFLRQLPILIHSIVPGVIDTAMQAQIRRTSREKFPSLDRFQALYREGELASPDTTALKIIRLLDNPELRQETLLSLRNI